MAAIDIREGNDPLRDASRPYGQASADANALRALQSIGGAGPDVPDIQSPDAKSRNAAPPVALRPLVAPGTMLPYPGASGRPAQGDDGGLQQPTFQSSDVLSDRALAMFPPAVQSAFANRKIDRPSDTSDIYGAPPRSTNLGGAYYPPDWENNQGGKIALGRGIEKSSGPADAVNGATHEILHAIAYEGEGFSQDRVAGYPELAAALFDSLPAILSNPQTRERAQEAANKIDTDPDHAFTAIGDLYIHGVPLPAQLTAYFDQMKDYRPSSAESEGAPAVEKGATASPTPTPEPRNPFPKTGSGAGIGDVASAIGTTLDRFVHGGAAQVQQGWDKIAQGLPAAIDALVPHENHAPSNIAKSLIGDVGGGALQVVGSPFTAAAETERTAMVQNVPELNAAFEQALAAAPKQKPTGDAAQDARNAEQAQAAAASAAIDQGRTALWNAAQDPDLPWQTKVAALTVASLLGAESVAELGGPSMAYRIPSAFRAVRAWGLWGKLAEAEAAPVNESIQLRLDALNSAKTDLAREETAALSQVEGGLSARIGAKPGGLGAGEAAVGPAKTAEQTLAVLPDPAVTRNLGEIVNERLRLGSLRATTLGEAPVVISAEDERAILDGIQATAQEIAPHIEARTINLGDAMTAAAKNAEKTMFNALRRAMTEGEKFSMKNVTVGEDAEGKAVRLRQMVGSFDQAIESIRNTADRAGKTTEAENLLAPFVAARRTAMESLQAADAYNAAIKANVSVSVQEYRAASKTATQARLAEDRAYAATTRAGQRLAKSKASVATQEQKTAQRTESTVDSLQTRIDAAKRDAAAASQSVKYAVGGDLEPATAHAANGYVAPDIAEVWARNRLHTGTFDDPVVGRAMAEWVKQHPGEIDSSEHSWQQFTSSISSLTGADVTAVQKAIPKTGELTRTFYVAEQVFGQLVKEWRRMGALVREGAASETQLAEKTGQVMAFEDSLRRGIGEQGRALAARNLVKKADAVEVLAANDRVRLSYAQVEKLAKTIDNLEGQVAAAEAKGDGAMLAAARARLEASLTEFAAAKDSLTVARDASATAAEAVYKAALRKAVAQGATKDTAAVLAKYDPGDVVGIAAFLRSLKPQGLGDLAMRVLTAGRYGKIPAQLLNFLGNAENAFFQEALVRPLTKITARQASNISGVENIRGHETASAWIGMWGNTPDAMKFLGRTLWSGAADDLALKHGIADYETMIGQGLSSGSPVFRVAGKTFELSGPKAIPVDVTLRALYGADGFIRILFSGADRNAMAALKAYRAGQGTGGAVRAVAEEMTVAEREFIQKEGLIKSFNEPINQEKSGNIWEQAEAGLMKLQGANVGGFAPLRLLVPAMRFGMRNVETGLRYSGAGLITGARLAQRARNVNMTAEERLFMARQGMREMAEGAAGAALLITGFQLASAGITTGAYPTNVSERNRWATLGIQPMSFHIGDKYIPMGWFGPLGAPFALSALIADSSHDQTDDQLTDRIGRAVVGMGSYVFNQPAMYATKTLLDAVSTALTTGGMEGINTLISQMAVATSAGALAQTLTPVFDPYQRSPEGLIQRFFARYPGLSQTVPAKIDQRTGQKLERAVSGPGAILATDLGTARNESDLSAVEKATLGVNIGNLGQTITSGTASIKLSQDQFKAYEESARLKGNDAAAKIIETAVYKNNPDPAGRQAMLAAAYSKAADAAREELATNLIASATKPDEVFTALVMARNPSNVPEFRYVLTVSEMVVDGRLTTDVAKKLDDTRPRRSDGTAAPTVADLRAVAPLVRQYIAIRPQLRGDAAEWQTLVTQRAEMAAIKSSQGDAAAATYARAHPLIGIYANGAMTNPARADFVKAHPTVKNYIGGTEWEWVK